MITKLTKIYLESLGLLYILKNIIKVENWLFSTTLTVNRGKFSFYSIQDSFINSITFIFFYLNKLIESVFYNVFCFFQSSDNIIFQQSIISFNDGDSTSSRPAGDTPTEESDTNETHFPAESDSSAESGYSDEVPDFHIGGHAEESEDSIDPRPPESPIEPQPTVPQGRNPLVPDMATPGSSRSPTPQEGTPGNFGSAELGDTDMENSVGLVGGQSSSSSSSSDDESYSSPKNKRKWDTDSSGEESKGKRVKTSDDSTKSEQNTNKDNDKGIGLAAGAGIGQAGNMTEQVGNSEQVVDVVQESATDPAIVNSVVDAASKIFS